MHTTDHDQLVVAKVKLSFKLYVLTSQERKNSYTCAREGTKEGRKLIIDHDE